MSVGISRVRACEQKALQNICKYGSEQGTRISSLRIKGQGPIRSYEAMIAWASKRKIRLRGFLSTYDRARDSSRRRRKKRFSRIEIVAQDNWATNQLERFAVQTLVHESRAMEEFFIHLAFANLCSWNLFDKRVNESLTGPLEDMREVKRRRSSPPFSEQRSPPMKEPKDGPKNQGLESTPRVPGGEALKDKDSKR